jgi:hypothetical protein
MFEPQRAARSRTSPLLSTHFPYSVRPNYGGEGSCGPVRVGARGESVLGTSGRSVVVEAVVDGSACGSCGPVSRLWVAHRMYSLSPGGGEDVLAELPGAAATAGPQLARAALLAAHRATDARGDR